MLDCHFIWISTNSSRRNQPTKVTGKVFEGSTFTLDFAGLLGVHYGENVLEVCLCRGHARPREQHTQRPCCLLSLSPSPTCPFPLPRRSLRATELPGLTKLQNFPWLDRPPGNKTHSLGIKHQDPRKGRPYRFSWKGFMGSHQRGNFLLIT